MKKINPYAGFLVFIMLVGIILFWLKIDPRGIIICSMIAIGTVVFAINNVRDKTYKKVWRIALIMIAGSIVLLSIANMFEDKQRWGPMVFAILFYTVAQRQSHPKRSQ